VSAINKSKTSFLAINSGGSETGSPCTSGFHMMFNAGEEYARRLDGELSKLSVN
jgi:hypothetical protein